MMTAVRIGFALSLVALAACRKERPGEPLPASVPSVDASTADVSAATTVSADARPDRFLLVDDPTSTVSSRRS